MVKISYANKKAYGVRLGRILSKELRRRIPPGINAQDAEKDPNVELDLSGKALTDDGLSVFIDDLVQCMSYRDENYPKGAVRLTELCLSGNNLTVMALMKLSEVIFIGITSITKVDISNNSIRVTNEYERRALSAFLNAFRYSCLVKKIDFSGNRLENAGFDVLACMYFKGSYHLSNISLISKIVESSAEQAESANELEFYARKRGLRSIPYLIFSNTCNSPLCAFHLWNIVTAHESAELLLQFLPSGKNMAPPGLEGKNSGIVCTPNKGLSPLCQAYLELGKEIHNIMGADKRIDDTGLEAKSIEDREKAAIELEILKVKRIEMERVQKRLVISALESFGIHSVRLWAITFQLLVAARAILLDERNRPQELALWNSDENLGPLLKARINYQTSLTSRIWALNISNDAQIPQSPMGFPTSLFQRQSYANRFGHDTNLRLKAAYRSPYRFGLPIYVWRDILAMAFDELDILGREQQVRVVEYASDWTGIDQQIALRGGRESEQIWRILNTVDCLVYIFE
ncbi:leucine rich repeat protein [Nannizzia gypsea CBS 118893]|uniref:Leucine rich repeat protein n=1 Tax=Arthroderma gypseum (strain ATCC MYA-4604 / CBS 118893) TaxID=535722 RepID=E5QZT7_ARTGP|nr:leucine rich repeat protein [Nannizzia gypsea CBS 118893]EFQ97400.1 leucine rich repeat protein [Nannizzia gypsea CBS 118893]